MNFSLMSLITSLFFGTLILVFQRFLLSVTNYRGVVTTRILTIFNFLFMFRLIFPFEFGYTITIASKTILPTIKDFFNYHLITLFQQEVTILHVLFLIWGMGSLFKLYLLFRNYIKIKQFVRVTPDYQIKNRHQFHAVHSFKIVEGLDSPVVIGLRKPIVLLPKIDFSEKELNYILKHEALHISNLDLFVKYFYEIVIVIYWWNPLMYLFREQMDNVIELRTDEQLIQQLTYEERIEYVQTLVKVRENQIKKRKMGQYAFSFSYGTQNQLLFRTRNILEGRPRNYSLLTLLTVVVLGAFLSTSIIFEPHRIKEEHIGESFLVTADTNYLVKLADNQYALYMNGEFLTVITDKQWNENQDFQKLTIYQEESQPNEKN